MISGFFEGECSRMKSDSTTKYTRTSEDMSTTLAALKNPLTRTVIVQTCNNNIKISDDGASKIGAALQHPNCHLTGLALTALQHPKIGLLHISNGLQQLGSRITTLHLPNNQIDCESVASITRALQHTNSRVTELDLSDNRIDTHGVRLIASALEHSNCCVTILNLLNNRLANDYGARMIAGALLHPNCRVTELAIGHSGSNNEERMTSQGVIDIALALEHVNSSVTKLKLEADVGNDGARQLAHAFESINCCVTHLSLTCCRFGEKSMQHFTRALRHSNCRLIWLDISDNQIGNVTVSDDVELMLLADSLQHKNCRLTKLDITHNEIDSKGVEFIANALKHVNCRLTCLDLGYNPLLCAVGMKHIADALQNVNCRLTELDLTCCMIGSTGVNHISESLKHINCLLTEINLHENEIGLAGMKHVARALQHPSCRMAYVDLFEKDTLVEIAGMKYVFAALASRSTMSLLQDFPVGTIHLSNGETYNIEQCPDIPIELKNSIISKQASVSSIAIILHHISNSQQILVTGLMALRSIDNPEAGPLWRKLYELIGPFRSKIVEYLFWSNNFSNLKLRYYHGNTIR